MANQEITLDENGFAAETGEITVYNYDAETGEFISRTVEHIMQGVGIPAHSTVIIPPETNSGKAAVWKEDGSEWTVVEDHRGETVYSTVNGVPVELNSLGPIPEETTLIEPATTYDKWNGKKWVTDKEAQKLGQIAEADAQKEALIAAANAYISEQNWPSKLALGRLSDADKAKFNAWLDYIDAVTAVSTSTAPDITWPEKPAS